MKSSLYFLIASLGYFFYEINNENSLSAERKKENETPYQIEGDDILYYPWNDDVHNMDPENNNSKRHKKWNLKKIQLEGQFIDKPSIGNMF